MGNVSSRADEAAPASILLRDQNRLAIKSVKITTARNRVLYTITPNAFPATRFIVKREADEDVPVEYVQDPEQSNAAAGPNFLLRLSSHEDIVFYFTFLMRQPQNGTSAALEQPYSTDTIIQSLTFLFASTPRELDTLVTREFNADPNLHKNPNVDLLGDYSTAGRATEEFEWSWKWRPPKGDRDRGGGWRTSCSFVEYDQRAHRLNTLMTFSFWVNGMRTFGSPQSPSRLLHPIPGPRVRVPSAQSMDSRLSDSDTEPAYYREPPSPNIDSTIPEDALSIEHTAACEAVKVDINYQRPGQDITEADDGPLFRATMKTLEQKTGNMKARMKKVLRSAEAAKATQVERNKAVEAFMQALRDASHSNANAVQPALDHYFEKIAKEILAYDKQNAESLQKLIIDPISKLYNSEIKQVESKKKDFDEESNNYYAATKRYLSQRQDPVKEKKLAQSDSKYGQKKRNFELARFDYSSFMQDLHGGRKDQEVLSQLTKYAETSAKGFVSTAKNIEAKMPQLDALVAEVKEADKEYQLLRTGREEKRRTLEKGPRNELGGPDATLPASAMPAISRNGAYSEIEAGSGPGTVTEASSAEKRVSGTILNGVSGVQLQSDPNQSLSPGRSRSMNAGGQGRLGDHTDVDSREIPQTPNQQEKDRNNHMKEGLLWSLSRPGGNYIDPKGLNKQAWHKFWIVLDQGRLSEYTNWKERMEAHLDPIDLRVASVREARNADRRFCFEVLTPSYTRVYQAQSEEEMKAWILSINNALQSAFESKSPMAEQRSSSKPASSMARDLFGKSSSFHGHRSNSSSGPQSGSKAISRHATVAERPEMKRAHSSEERPAHLLQSIRDADAGNAWCADCNSESRVEWVSINLGIIICIECSGIHRSLGTHISKVRSLTLDTVSFTQDIVELLLRVGNRVSNMVWEATLDRGSGVKLTATSSREQRLQFITAKYVDRRFIKPHTTPPDDFLITSIKMEKLSNVLHALALSANPNATDRSRATHAVFLALAAADPASPAASTSASPAHGGDQKTGGRKSFPLAELLIQNGADVPTTAPPIPLGPSAWNYLEYKREQRAGRGSSVPLQSPAVMMHPITERTSSATHVSTKAPQLRDSDGPPDVSFSLAVPEDAGRPSVDGDKLTALPVFDGRYLVSRNGPGQS